MGLAGGGVERREHRAVVGKEVERAIDEQRRRDVGGALGMGPDDAVGAGQIARAIQSKRLQRVAPVTAHHEHTILAGDRRGNGVHRLPGAFPEQFSVLEIVAANLVGAVDDHLLAAAVGDDERGAPPGGLVAGLTPEFATTPLVESHDEVVTLMVPEHDHGVAVEGRRTALAEAVAGAHVAQVLLPKKFALQVIPIEAERSERDDQVLAVRDRRGGGEAMVLVMPLVRQLSAWRVAPALPAGLAVEADHRELLRAGRAVDHATTAATARATPPAPGASASGPIRTLGSIRSSGRGSRLLGRRLRPRGDGRQHEDLIAPDDRRGGPPARNRRLPLHMVGLTPPGGRVCVGRDTIGQRTSPGGPVGGGAHRCEESRGREATGQDGDPERR